ncbi:Ig-like domain-containing protein [Mesorhizobium sp. CC13]|uniref:Ig-like domain-containing protein n=1 Tax=Mesorhizobium sp. CC13 TaxID=3029194 RepID=UPI00326722B2
MMLILCVGLLWPSMALSAPPTATAVVSNTMLKIGDTSLVTITFSEQVTGFNNADLIASNGSLTAVSSSDGGITWTATFAPSAGISDSTNLIVLNMTGVASGGGEAGSGTVNSNNYAIDTMRPTATIVVADTALGIGQTSLVTVAFSEAVAGFSNADLSVGNGSLSALSSSDGGISWAATLTPTAGITDTSNLITLDNTGVIDSAGNNGSGTTDSNNYAVDSQRPTATLVMADPTLAAGDTSLLTITFSEAVTGFDNADLTVPNGTLSTVSSSDGGITWTATFNPNAGVSDATNLLTLNNAGVTDVAGNAGTGMTNSANFTIDTVLPTATVVVADNALKTDETSLVTITFSEAVTGFNNADLTVSNGTLSAVSSSDGGVSWTATFTPSANVSDASNVISLDMTGVQNASGNTGSGTVDSNNYAIDTAGPTATIDVEVTSLRDGETSPVTITFSEAVTGLGLTDLSLTGGTTSALRTSDNIVWTFTLTATGTSASRNTITLAASAVSDAAGNPGSSAVSNSYATNPPTISLAPATLPNPTLGVAYSQMLTATGGTTPHTFAISDNALPNGLALSPAGNVSGTPTVTGTFNFTVKVTDALGFTAEQAYSMTVGAPAPVAVSRRISVDAGKQVTVDLTDGATGGPFTAAALVSLSSAAAGAAAITGTELTFDAAITFEGEATVVFTLSNASAASAPTSIYFDVTGRPDPSEDAEVTGLLTAQVDSARRFAESQTQNFNSRLEQLHDEGERRRNSMAVRLGYSGNDGKTDEDQRFEDLLGKAPKGAAGSGFAMHNYADDENGRQPAQSPVDVDLGKLAVWTGGFVNFGERDDGRLNLDYTTAGVSGGIDYRFSKSLVAGFGLGYGRDATDIGPNGTESRAHAYSGAVYASYSPFRSAYLDGLVGGSWLDLSSRRYETSNGGYAIGERSGTQIFGSITASYEKRDDAWLISPYGRLDLSRSWLSGFTEGGSGDYLLKYGSQTVDTLSGIAGLRVEYAITTDWGVLKPGARIEYVHDFEGSSRVNLGYADTDGLPYVFDIDSKGSDYATLGASLDAALGNNWTARFDYRTAVGGVGQSHALGLKVGKNF